MIKKNNKEVGFIEKGTTNIDKIYKGTNLVFEQGFDREDSGVPPLTTSHEAIGKDLKDYKIYGNSIQDGTPSPSNPVEIKSVGDLITDTNDANYGKYKISIKVSGKNLIWLKDATNISATNQIYNCSNQTFEKEITNPVGITKIISATAFPSIIYSEQLQSGKTYIWKFNNATLLSTGHYLVLTYEDETTQNWYENTPITLVKNATITNLRQNYHNYAKGDSESFQIQVEEGSVATDYELYKAPVVTNIYLDEPLRKIGDYADYIDFENGKVVRKVKAKKIDSVTSYNDSTKYFTEYFSDMVSKNVVDSQQLILSSHYAYDTRTWSDKNLEYGFVVNNKNLEVRNLNYNSTTDFNNYLSAHPFVVNYALSTPTEESVTLPTIPSIKGTTIYEVETSITPSNMYIKYKGR